MCHENAGFFQEPHSGAGDALIGIYHVNHVVMISFQRSCEIFGLG
jgi:hypothetical protein